MTTPLGRQFREAFEQAATTSRIGGSDVLRDLAQRARRCATGASASTDAVAFALSVILEQHAEDLDDRPVTGDDTYALMSASYDDLAAAAAFLERDGPPEQAVEIIAALARLSPAVLHGH